jgi:hypothetical protein
MTVFSLIGYHRLGDQLHILYQAVQNDIRKSPSTETIRQKEEDGEHGKPDETT